MMIVIANAEPLLDQVADHRTGPDTGLIACLHRAQFNDDPQSLALLVGELRRRAFGNRSPKPLNVIDVVPLEPAIDGAACDAEVDRDVRDFSSIDVCTNSTAPTPFAEVVLELRFDDKIVELFELRATATRATNCLAWLRSSHDRRTMILSGSFVNRRGSQPVRSCLEGVRLRRILGFEPNKWVLCQFIHTGLRCQTLRVGYYDKPAEWLTARTAFASHAARTLAW